MMFQTNLLKVILCLIIAALLFFGPYTDFIPYSAFGQQIKKMLCGSLYAAILLR